MPSFGGHPDGTVTGVPAAGISLGEVVVVVSWCMAALAVIAAGFDAWAWHAYGDHWFGDHGPRFSEFALHHWTELEALRGLVRSLIGAVWAVGLTVTVAWWRRGPGAVGFARRR
ncbi:MAG: hypothetical protein S0880_14450, partial [Actinomycetota bacterium]|nr:hypothetical protein [Actinomycetota bacterium]